VDPDYFDVYCLRLKEGRLFSWQNKGDEFKTCIMNEAAVRAFGLDSPVGTVFNHSRTQSSSFPAKKVEVIGVVKDFHFQSLRDEIFPLLFSWNPGWLWMTNVRLSGRNLSRTIGYMEKIWREIAPGFPFSYSFLDEQFDQEYKSDTQFGKIFAYFAALSIFISCLGLVGLAFFSAEQRSKEIGIRKILGSPMTGILFLLSKDFTKWVVLANFFAWPAAYFVMNLWLNTFAYRNPMKMGVFFVAALSALGVALLAVSHQTIKAARANPVSSLQAE
jgi:putative ABC transport system permease protein